MMVSARFIGGPLHGKTGLRVPAWPCPTKDFSDGRRVPSGWPSCWGPTWVVSSTRGCRHYYVHKKNGSIPTRSTYEFAGTWRATGAVTTASEDTFLRQAGTVSQLPDAALIRVFPGSEIEHMTTIERLAA